MIAEQTIEGPTRDRPSAGVTYPTYLPLKTTLAALVVVNGGRAPFRELVRHAHRLGVHGSPRRGPNAGNPVARATGRKLQQLIEDGLLVRVGEDYVAVDLIRLAAWLAEEVEYEITRTLSGGRTRRVEGEDE